MKLLTPERMIEFCEPTAKQINDAAILFSEKFGDGEWIRDGLRSGFYKSEVCVVDGKESYLAVFHVTEQNSLMVNALVRLQAGDCGLHLVESVKALATKYGCRAISAITVRAGLVKTLIAAGFDPVGVKLTLCL